MCAGAAVRAMRRRCDRYRFALGYSITTATQIQILLLYVTPVLKRCVFGKAKIWDSFAAIHIKSRQVSDLKNNMGKQTDVVANLTLQWDLEDGRNLRSRLPRVQQLQGGSIS